jgi:hypothetical protein
MQDKRSSPSSSEESLSKRQKLDEAEACQSHSETSNFQSSSDGSIQPQLQKLLKMRPDNANPPVNRKLREDFVDFRLLFEVAKLVDGVTVSDSTTIPSSLTFGNLKNQVPLTLCVKITCQVLLMGKNIDMTLTANGLPNTHEDAFDPSGEPSPAHRQYLADKQYFLQTTFSDLLQLCVTLVERRLHLYDLFQNSKLAELDQVTQEDLLLCKSAIQAALDYLGPAPELAECAGEVSGEEGEEEPEKQKKTAARGRPSATTEKQPERKRSHDLEEVLEVLVVRKNRERPAIAREMEPHLAALTENSVDEAATRVNVMAVVQSAARNRFEHGLVQAAALTQLKKLQPRGTKWPKVVELVNELLGSSVLTYRTLRRDRSVLKVCLNWPGLARDFVGLTCSDIRDYCAILRTPAAAERLRQLGYEDGAVDIAQLWANLTKP